MNAHSLHRAVPRKTSHLHHEAISLMSQDLISKPASGRYFPLSHAEVVALVKTHDFAVHCLGDRLAVRLENCDVECGRGHQLCSFFRQSYFAGFSLPESVPLATGRKAVTFALEYFKRIDLEPRVAHHQQEFVIYRAYLAPLGVVSIARHVVKGGYRSYRKFQSSSQLSKSHIAPDHQHFLASIQIT